jgi:hypothetical protein
MVTMWGDLQPGRDFTLPGVLIRYLWGLCLMSRLICIILVVDLMIACRLIFFMVALACRPVTPRLWSGFLVWLL